MPKSNPVDEMRIADAVEPTKLQRRSHAKKAGRPTKAGPNRQVRRKGAVVSRSRTKPAIRKETKQQTCINLLCHRQGATIEELQAVTGWQAHSVRGFLAGTIRKKLCLTLESEKPDEKPRRYRTLNAV